jgi:hypothetical protein
VDGGHGWLRGPVEFNDSVRPTGDVHDPAN